MVTVLALQGGGAMMWLGFGLSKERFWRAGILIGTGMGIGFMSKGFISPILFVLTAASLPIFFQNWRTRHYYLSLAVAFLFALPWLTIWPLLLYQHSPKLFADWAWTLNICLLYTSPSPR